MNTPRCLYPSLAIATSLMVVITSAVATKAQSRPYTPIPLSVSRQIEDTLSAQDMPTGFGGFSRDYSLTLTAGDQVAIDAASDDFDTLVALISKEGTTVGENDDGPDGSTNSLLFVRITESGLYTVRVSAYAGGSTTGKFRLKVARLKEVP
ncbi:MAG: pre-peptidase C-terminal domain-containing protein [Cyanobacteria bacterium REEB459]|nr:pre-peptidase C-terminal domain-containing protein [Cyanobacteria bacterium REEB459]